EVQITERASQGDRAQVRRICDARRLRLARGKSARDLSSLALDVGLIAEFRRLADRVHATRHGRLQDAVGDGMKLQHRPPGPRVRWDEAASGVERIQVFAAESRPDEYAFLGQ